VGLRVLLDMVKRKIPSPHEELNHRTPIIFMELNSDHYASFDAFTVVMFQVKVFWVVTPEDRGSMDL
jgi:hypothetical protein